jgi:hypothetical protein
MSDTMDAAIKAAEAFFAEAKTPKVRGKKGPPARADEWLAWPRTTAARADGSRSRVDSQRAKASPAELERAYELMDELKALAERSRAAAGALTQRSRI